MNLGDVAQEYSCSIPQPTLLKPLFGALTRLTENEATSNPEYYKPEYRKKEIITNIELSVKI